MNPPNKSSFGEGIKVVGVSDFKDYSKPRYAELEQINPEGIVTERNILRDGDIVFVRSNGNRELIGRSLLIEQPPEEVTHSAFTIRLRFTTREAHPKFYAYCFRTRLIRQALTAQGGGTNINNLNQDILSALEVPVPPLPTQRRIAGILSAYDELIDNSERRIKILESMARALYREWFVHFRFPGHESVPNVPSLLGDIPQGWEVRSVRQVAGLVSRGPSLSYVESGGVPVVNQRCIRNEEIEMQAVQYAAPLPEKKAHLYLQLRDVLINSMGVGTLGRVSRNLTIDEPTIIHNCITVVRGKAGEPTTALLYYRLSDCQVHFESLGVGATGQTSLRIETIEDVQFAYPPLALLSDFEKVILPMWTQVGSLKRQVQNLRRIRDLLLPRLLSGQIDVEAMPS